MPYNGNGIFTPVYNWQTDKANGIKIRADRMDGQDGDIATGLSTVICSDGQSSISADIPFNTHKITGLGAGTSRTDAANVSQLQDNGATFFTTTGGTADAYVGTPSPAITAYSKGLSFFVRIHSANTTTTPTLNISGVGAGTISNGDLSALAIGDLVVDGVYRVTYEGTAGFVLPNRGGGNPWGMVDGGSHNADFSLTPNTRTTVYPPTAGCAVLLPNSSSAAGKFALLVKLGPYDMNLCGTVNGIAGTITISDRQSLPISCTTVDGWV